MNRSTRSRDISFSKASWGPVGLGWDPPPVRVLMFSLQTSYAKVSVEDEVRHMGDGYEAFCQTRGQSRDQL